MSIIVRPLITTMAVVGLLLCNFRCSLIRRIDELDGSVKRLETEFLEVPDPRNSNARRPTTVQKAGIAVFSKDYKSTLSESEITSHYRTELEKRGWKYCGEQKVIYRGQDYGGKHVFFRKDLYVADIQFAGKQSEEFDWNFAFGMSWGIWDEVRCV